MKYTFLSAAFISMIGSLQAANFLSSSHPNLDGGAGDRFILDVGPATASFLLNSGYAGTGRFNLSDSDVDLAVSTGGTFAALLAPGAFNPYVGVDDFSTGITNLLGAVPGAYAISSAVNPGANAGATLYTFIGNGTTLAGSTAIALFRHTIAIAADDPGSPTPNEYAPDLVNGLLLVGTAVSLSVTDANLGITNQLVSGVQLVEVIPEPSSAMMTIVGALFLLRRKR